MTNEVIFYRILEIKLEISIIFKNIKKIEIKILVK